MLMLLKTANVINATLYQNLNYDLMRDIMPVGSIDSEPFVLEVNPSVRAKTLQDFIALRQSQSGQGYDGVGGYRQRAAYLRRNVPADGRNPARPHSLSPSNPILDVIGDGQVDCFIGPVQIGAGIHPDWQVARALGLDDRTAVRRLA